MLPAGAAPTEKGAERRAVAAGEVYKRAKEREWGWRGEETALGTSGGERLGSKGGVSHLAEWAGEAGQAEALEAVHLVLTAAAVEARRARALVHVPLAVIAGEARRAEAVVAVHQVLVREDEKEEEEGG